MQRQTIVLNFDDSTDLSKDHLAIDLQNWQEKIRFATSWHNFKLLSHYLKQQLPDVRQLGCVFMGSGDYHHISQILLRRFSEPLHLIICDNHPDNMRYPFGIHCGSWVYWASRLPHITRIDVIGINSQDIAFKHAWENHWTPLMQAKLHYWSINVNASWTKLLGAKQQWHGFSNADDLIQQFLHEIESINIPRYISIDKDVLSEQEVKTNWDQGQFYFEHLQQLIQASEGQLVGADVTGEISVYRYQSKFKAILSEMDGQTEISAEQIQTWQQQQAKINNRLLQSLTLAFRV